MELFYYKNLPSWIGYQNISATPWIGLWGKPDAKRKTLVQEQLLELAVVSRALGDLEPTTRANYI